MSTIYFSDLHERPYFLSRVIELFMQAQSSDAHHAVCGEPRRMGMTPQADDFTNSMGCLIAIEEGHLTGALCMCPYSDEQATLWGPVFVGAFDNELATMLFARAQESLRNNEFWTLRTLVDTRNQPANDFYRGNGLQLFENNILYARALGKDIQKNIRAASKHIKQQKKERKKENAQEKELDGSRYYFGIASTDTELASVRRMLQQAFPDNGHCSESMRTRLADGYIHYTLSVDSSDSSEQAPSRMVGCVVLSRHHRRSWISLVTIDSEYRGQGRSTQILTETINSEYRHGQTHLALEVLANNQPARALYEHCGFEHQWDADILSGGL